ncbi:MAG: sensor histidine kinase [Runella zeae]
MESPPLDITIILISGTIAFLFLMSFLISFLFIYKKKQQINRQEKAALHAQYQQEILQAQIEIQNQTLAHVGKELHDNIGQLLSVARLQLNILESEETPTLIQVKEVNDIIAQTIDELRALSKSLDGDFVKDFGLVESLSHELGRIRQTGKYHTEIIQQGEPYRLEGKKEMVVFRVVQEILNNILKHAAAKNIKVLLQYQPEAFVLIVQDDGRGFDKAQVLDKTLEVSGAGLRNIQRRTELLGGNCLIESTPGLGTKVQLLLPSTKPIP